MANAGDDDPEIGSLTSYLDRKPAQAIVSNQRQRAIDIKTNVLGNLPTFSGRRNECPYEFLNEFSKLCSIHKRPNDATKEDYRLRAIPFALKGEANTWLLRLPPDSINTWKDFKLEFLDYFFPSNKTNALKKEIQECKQEYDESLSQYWSRFKGLLDACPNHRMMEAETYYLFYEGAKPESKDLMNTASGGNFTKRKVDEAREILGRLIDAKKAYDSPRTILRSGSADVVTVQSEERMDAQVDARMDVRMEQLEKTILAALGKNDSPGPTEKDKQALGPEDGYNYCRSPGGMDCPAHRETKGTNPTGLEEIKRDRTTGIKEDKGSSYVPPHQRNNNYQGPGNQYNNNQGGQGNFRPHQGGGPNHGQGPSGSQPNSRTQRNLDDMVHDLVSSQQHMQNNLLANNDVVHKLQDAQQEHKAAMDLMSKQLSQIATSLSDMRGNEGRIPASVKPPERANISQVTLRSGKAYEGPKLKVNDENVSADERGCYPPGPTKRRSQSRG
ncbi:uncharacterized protein LOC125195085 [Salvia hispanica]|uniref:uncharacterized protein LOC125195085 n=1 Tax=Salvia hispanica TaxID=49212 RepID=UPI002009B7AE|nr:uncharacterized protein LOC125195085 [Salvia hispanica]